MYRSALFLLAGALAAADLPNEITALKGGVVVAINAAQLDALKPLATSGAWAVEAVLPDAKSAWELRAKLAADPAYGLLSVTDAAHGLPYADRTATVTVVDRDAPGAPADAEIDRITSPFGVIWERKGGAWAIRRSAPTPGWDEWKLQFRDPEGSCVSRDTVVAPADGMAWIDNRTGLGKEGSGGYRLHRGTAVTLEAGELGERPPRASDVRLVARDAFNGALLWAKPIIGLVFDGISYFAHDGLLFATLTVDQPMVAYDMRSGAVVRSFDQGLKAINGGPKSKLVAQMEAVIAGGVLVQSAGNELIGLDPQSGARKWAHREADGLWIYTLRAAEAEGLAFACVATKPVGRGRTTTDGDARHVIAIDLATGKERWRWNVPGGEGTKVNRHATHLSYDRGQLLCVGSAYWYDPPFKGVQNLSLIDAKTGATVWQKLAGQSNEEGNNSALGQGGTMYGIFIGDEVWTIAQGAWVQRGFKRSDGTPTRMFRNDIDGNCQRPIATVNWLNSSMHMRWSDLNWTRQAFARSVCGAGAFPAYGRRYFTQNGCGCADYLRGVISVWSGPLPTPVDDAKRTERFAALPAAKPNAGGWPMHLGTPIGGNSGSDALPRQITTAWSSEPLPPPKGTLTFGWHHSDPEGNKRNYDQDLDPLSGAVASGDLVVVAERHRHQVVARDAATGKERWRFTAAGRVDQAPTLLDGLCVFGSRDGYVWALDASTGAPVWRHLVAPTPRRILAHGQLEAASRVHGSVIPVGNGEIVSQAGRHPELDGGMWFTRLKRDGSLVWRSNDNLRMPILPPDQGTAWLKKANANYAGSINIWGGTRGEPMQFNGNHLGTGNISIDPANGAVTRHTTTNSEGAQIPYPYKYGRPPSLWSHAQVHPLINSGKGGAPGWLATLPDGRTAGLRGFTTAKGYGRYGGELFTGLWAFPNRMTTTPSWKRDDAAQGLTLNTVIGAGDAWLVVGSVSGKGGGPVARRFAAADGAPQGEIALPALPVSYGLSAAGGRIFISDAQGRLHALAGK